MKGNVIHFKTPTLEHSSDVHELVDRCKPLDVNSRYCYMLVCNHFRDTSIVTEVAGRIKGLVSGYLGPKNPKRFFIWHVDLALRMLKALLTRRGLRHIRFIETTISPSNTASRNLFHRRLAQLQTAISDRPYFDRALFGGEAHEDEHLYRIGPLSDNAIQGDY